MNVELAAPLFLGLMSSAHCIGMCGGFAAAIGAARGGGGAVSGRGPLGQAASGGTSLSAVSRQLIYSTGGVTTYTFLGAMVGYAGFRLGGASSFYSSAQRWLSVGAGLLMVLIGLTALGFFRLRPFASLGVERLLAPAYSCLLSVRRPHEYFFAGLANGFLPCGLLYAVLATALASGSVFQGAAIMLIFGLGTIPAMVAVGCGTHLLGHTMRLRVHRMAAVLVLAVGGVTIQRGLPSGMGGPSCCEEAAARVTEATH